MAALTLPKIEGEPVDDFAKRIKADAQTQGKEARDKGVFIHGEVEKFYAVGYTNIKYWDLCRAVDASITQIFGV